MNRYPRPHLVSVTDRAGHQLYPATPTDRDSLHTPRTRAQRLLADRQRRATDSLPSLIPCPRDPHHMARALAGGDHIWCPRCQRVLALNEPEQEQAPSRTPLYAALGLLAIWLAVIGLWGA